MKHLSTCILYLCLVFVSLSCIQPPDVKENEQKDPNASLKEVRFMTYFNQLNSAFNAGELQCLINSWHRSIYMMQGPVAFAVINDDSTYRAFFRCAPEIGLQSIDFRNHTLLIGTATSSSQFNTPVGITKTQQIYFPSSATGTGEGLLQVRITGRNSSDGKGGEWFGFAARIPKTNRKINLDLDFIFEN